MQVFRTYLQSIEKNKIVFQYISQGHSSRINGRERSAAAAESPSSKYCTYDRGKLRTLELLCRILNKDL